MFGTTKELKAENELLKSELSEKSTLLDNLLKEKAEFEAIKEEMSADFKEMSDKFSALNSDYVALKEEKEKLEQNQSEFENKIADFDKKVSDQAVNIVASMGHTPVESTKEDDESLSSLGNLAALQEKAKNAKTATAKFAANEEILTLLSGRK